MRGWTNRGAVQAAPRSRGLNPAACLVAIVLLAALTAPGCYSYSMIEPAQAGVGLDVRARISPAESLRIEEMTDVRERVLLGEVVAVDSAMLVLSIPTVLAEPGLSTNRLHQRIALSHSAIVELEQRQLSRWRTFSVIGAAAAIAGYVVVTQFDADDDDGGSDKGGGTDNLVLKLRYGFD